MQFYYIYLPINLKIATDKNVYVIYVIDFDSHDW